MYSACTGVSRQGCPGALVFHSLTRLSATCGGRTKILCKFWSTATCPFFCQQIMISYQLSQGAFAFRTITLHTSDVGFSAHHQWLLLHCTQHHLLSLIQIYCCQKQPAPLPVLPLRNVCITYSCSAASTCCTAVRTKAQRVRAVLTDGCSCTTRIRCSVT